MSIRHSAVSLAGHGLVLTPQLGAQGSEAPAVVVGGVDGLDDPAGHLIDECGGKLFPPVKAVEQREFPAQGRRGGRGQILVRQQPGDGVGCVTVVDAPAGDACLLGQRRQTQNCLLYTSPSPRDRTRSRMPSSA